MYNKRSLQKKNAQRKWSWFLKCLLSEWSVNLKDFLIKAFLIIFVITASEL